MAAVGYTGWATLGGYGECSAVYGLGSDQIVSLKVVDARAEIVDVSCESMRGGGEVSGVVVELTIRVHSLEKVRFFYSIWGW